eukprot:scaffold757_cov246-Pinguiococcus_pyrenoidosus.AAC.37
MNFTEDGTIELRRRDSDVSQSNSREWSESSLFRRKIEWKSDSSGLIPRPQGAGRAGESAQKAVPAVTAAARVSRGLDEAQRGGRREARPCDPHDASESDPGGPGLRPRPPQAFPQDLGQRPVQQRAVSAVPDLPVRPELRGVHPGDVHGHGDSGGRGVLRGHRDHHLHRLRLRHLRPPLRGGEPAGLPEKRRRGGGRRRPAAHHRLGPRDALRLLEVPAGAQGGAVAPDPSLDADPREPESVPLAREGGEGRLRGSGWSPRRLRGRHVLERHQRAGAEPGARAPVHQPDNRYRGDGVHRQRHHPYAGVQEGGHRGQRRPELRLPSRGVLRDRDHHHGRLRRHLALQHSGATDHGGDHLPRVRGHSLSGEDAPFRAVAAVEPPRLVPPQARHGPPPGADGGDHLRQRHHRVARDLPPGSPRVRQGPGGDPVAQRADHADSRRHPKPGVPIQGDVPQGVSSERAGLGAGRRTHGRGGDGAGQQAQPGDPRGGHGRGLAGAERGELLPGAAEERERPESLYGAHPTPGDAPPEDRWASARRLHGRSEAVTSRAQLPVPGAEHVACQPHAQPQRHAPGGAA